MHTIVKIDLLLAINVSVASMAALSWQVTAFTNWQLAVLVKRKTNEEKARWAWLETGGIFSGGWLCHQSAAGQSKSEQSKTGQAAETLVFVPLRFNLGKLPGKLIEFYPDFFFFSLLQVKLLTVASGIVHWFLLGVFNYNLCKFIHSV
jgi:hypothetical protein